MVKAHSLVISVDFFLKIPKIEFLDLQGLSEFPKSGEFIDLLGNHFKVAWKYFQSPLKLQNLSAPFICILYNT